MKAHAGASLVIAGDEQPPQIHALAHAMNAALGNVGKTVSFVEPVEEQPVDQLNDLRTLVGEIDAGAVEILVIVGGNPVYTTPVDLKLDAERMKKVGTAVHLSLYEDETSELCHWHIPETHYLEAWGDTRAFDGTITIMQPLITPLYSGKSAYELLAAFTDNPDRRGYDIIRNYWLTEGKAALMSGGTAANSAGPQGGAANNNNGASNSNAGTASVAAHAGGAAAPSGASSGSASNNASGAGASTTAATASPEFERAWRRALNDGFVANTARKPRAGGNSGGNGSPSGAQTNATAATTAPAPSGGGGQFEIVFRTDPSGASRTTAGFRSCRSP